jgi:hypothetical protein
MVAPVIEKDKREKKDDGKNKGKKPGDAAFNGLDVKSTRRPRAGENKRTAPGHSSDSTFHTRSFQTGSPFLIR